MKSIDYLPKIIAADVATKPVERVTFDQISKLVLLKLQDSDSLLNPEESWNFFQKQGKKSTKAKGKKHSKGSSQVNAVFQYSLNSFLIESSFDGLIKPLTPRVKPWVIQSSNF